jgi:hypothetical protein
MAISTSHTPSLVASRSNSVVMKKDEEHSRASRASMTREELIKALDMKEDLCVRGSASDKGILHAFAKYQEINKAYTHLQNSTTWAGKKPLRLTIIELCMSKSQFYDDFHPVFSQAVKYPDMMKWLTQEEDCMSGYDLFGIEKSFYTKKDLDGWVEKKKGKGKEKEKEESKKKSSKKSHKKQ